LFNWQLQIDNWQKLSLALLKAGILFVNYIQPAFSANNFAVGATLFDGCSNFHFLKLCAASCSLRAIVINYMNKLMLTYIGK
jgi:hypothetical protein